MVKAIRCSYCGANLEIDELDNRDSYSEVFVSSGCEASECPGTELIPDWLKTPERQMYEAIFGQEDVEPGIYLIETEGEGNELEGEEETNWYE